MAEYLETNPETGRLEQVQLRMPRVTFYFSGDRDATADSLYAYIGEQRLELLSLQRFCETEEGMDYYILLDVSASISRQEFAELKEALVSFVQGLPAQDRVSLLTFGDQVQTVFSESGEALLSAGVEDQILALENTDQHTLLFEAVNQMAKLAQTAAAKEDIRQVAFVITDGEDMARGKATIEEAGQVLKQSGVPVYGFTVQSAPKAAVDSFGEFSRSSGGSLTILSNGQMEEQMLAVKEELTSYWQAIFQAESNKVTNGMVNLSLEFADTGEKRQIQRLQEHWIADTQAPSVTAVEKQGERQLELTFSEAVTGAEAANNYELVPVREAGMAVSDQAAETQTAATKTEALVPAYASVGADAKSVVLTFAEDIQGGDYLLRVSGITDDSMERNPMAQEQAVTWTADTAAAPEITEEPAFVPLYPLLGAAGLLFLIFIFFLFKRNRKRKQDQAACSDMKKENTDEKILQAGLAPNRHIQIENRTLEEKRIWFLIRGQKEELELTLQKSMIVGRSPGCELSFEDPSMSRQHFVLELQEGQILIRNLSQSSQTLVNGAAIGQGAMKLSSGDWIGAGQLQIRIRF